MNDVTAVKDLSNDFAQLADPYAVLDELRSDSPVTRVRLRSEFDVWIVTGYHEAVTALNDHRLSADLQHATAITPRIPPKQRHNVLMESLLVSDPPDHTRLRSIVAKAFTARRVAALAPRVQEIVDDLLDPIAPLGEADLVPTLNYPLPVAVICSLLGVPREDQDLFQNWSVGLAMPPADPDTLRRADRARQEMVAYFDTLIARQRVAPDDTLLGALCAANSEDRLTDDEVVGMAMMLLLSGHETTLCLLGTGIVALLEHPDQWAMLRADPDLVPGAVEELMRYDGPVTRGVARFTREDVTIGGVTIPAGEMVIVCIAAANRDPARFDRPDVLDVTRKHNVQLGFGHGPHHCLGAALARMQVATALTTLLRRFPDLTLAVPAAELPRRRGMLRGVASLPVRFTPH